MRLRIPIPTSLAGCNERVRRRRARWLSAALLFEACILGGVLAGPLIQDWIPGSMVRVPDPVRGLVDWRRSRYDPANDPRLGDKAPPLELQTEAGRHMSLADLAGGNVVLVFAREGST